MSNSPASYLLQLPAELRNDIYEYLLGGYMFRNHRAVPRKCAQRDPQVVDNRIVIGPVVAIDVSLFLYSKNVFSFASHRSFEEFIGWHVPEELQAITALQLQTWNGCNMVSKPVSFMEYNGAMLSRMSNLRIIHLLDVQYSEGHNFVELARLFRTTNPGVQFSARERDGAYMIDIGVL